MSIARLAMRLATARAILGRTIAEGRVFDSAIDPINQTISENREPLVVVTTDSHEVTIVGRDLVSGNHQCDLVIELAIASAVEVPADDGQGGEISVAIPHTDEGMEILLDLLEHQVIAALTKDDNLWTEAWMALVPLVHRRSSIRGASTEKGVRFAARQIVLTCDLLDTPLNAAEATAGTAWGKFLAAMDADPNLAPIASMLRAEIDQAGSTGWKSNAQELGIQIGTLAQLGLDPALDANGNPVQLDAVLVDEAGAITMIDAASADEQGV